MQFPPCDRPDECRHEANGPACSTLMYFPPIYDGHGRNLNPDRNTVHTPMRCTTCGKTWDAGAAQPDPTP